MTLAPERKVSILLIWTFLIGLVVGLLFATVREQNKQNQRLMFTTQSVWGEDVVVVTQEIPCPWEEDIRGGVTIEMSNPLVDRANELFSLQQGMISENYIQQWPIGKTIGPWKGKLITQTIDQVTAGIEDNQAFCVYSSLWKDIVMLQKNNVGNDCEAMTTPNFVWFSCLEQ